MFGGRWRLLALDVTFLMMLTANAETLPTSVASKLTAISHSGDEQVSSLFACRRVRDVLKVVDEILSFRATEKIPKKGDGKVLQL